MSKALRGTVVFTVIEIITLQAWLIVALMGHPVLSTLILLGLYLEHHVSVNVGAGRPWFGSLPPDR